jgi:6-phosphogluconolactonase (cycloisomerase 2 family)
VAASGRIRESDLRKSNWPLGFSNAIPGSGKNLPPSITVYARTASGDTAPLRVIQGPKTQMNWPTGIAFDPRSNELFVANDMGDSILVFNASASGDVAPIRVLTGPKTLIKNPTGVYVDTTNDELWVANFGNHTATAYKLSAAGDIAPLRVIRSAPSDQPTLSIGNPHPVAYDTKREQLLVPN